MVLNFGAFDSLANVSDTDFVSSLVDFILQVQQDYSSSLPYVSFFSSPFVYLLLLRIFDSFVGDNIVWSSC